jgi:ferredoxin
MRTKEKAMRVEADTTRCTGAGMCALTAERVFDQSEVDGTVVLLTEQPAPEDVAAVRLAVASCPTHALDLVDPA